MKWHLPIKHLLVAALCETSATRATDTGPKDSLFPRPPTRFQPDPNKAARSGTAGLLLLLIADLVIGCSSPIELPRPGTAGLPKPIPPTWTYTTPKGIEMIAEAVGNLVRVAVVNHTDQGVLVGPKMFALIADGKLHRIDSATVTIRFPVRKLRPHEQVLGTFQFRHFKSVEGAKIVLNSPDVGAQIVEIASLRSRPPNYTPNLPPLTKRELRRIRREQEELREALLPELQKLQK